MKAGFPMTDEEVYMVRERILFPVILDVLERDISHLQESSLKMGSVYISLLRKVQDEVTKEFNHYKKQLHKKGIKICSEQRTAHMLESKYLCRGYLHEMNMLWSFVKAEVEIRISKYILKEGE